MQILAKKQELNDFSMVDANNNEVNHLDDLVWEKVIGVNEEGDGNTWYSAIVNMDITTGEPYTINNTQGLFHLSILDKNDPNNGPGSVSYGYYSSYASIGTSNHLDLGTDVEMYERTLLELSGNALFNNYVWKFKKDGITNLETLTNQSPEHTYVITNTEERDSGIYFCKATDLNGCNVYDEINVNILPLGTNLNKDHDSSIYILPNPATNEIVVKRSLGEEIRIFNISGELLYKQTSTSNHHKIIVNNYSSGTYIIAVGNSISKFIKK